ncbi:hypothetical protein NP493_857g00078 [Ridgeia piscesae]|uniref:Uncharacterized protein n=1 Tax=Ridgeia piscesae TaxID=27915 RepID=A0AAD9KM32_RIDPI|nr:hypothetical protein NP493_857g00078 [Ridgeia piscesae]
MAAGAPLFHATKSEEGEVKGHGLSRKPSEMSLLDTLGIDRDDSGYCVSEKTSDVISLNDVTSQKTPDITVSESEHGSDARRSMVQKTPLSDTDDVEMPESERVASRQSSCYILFEMDDVQSVTQKTLDIGFSDMSKEQHVLVDQELVHSYITGLAVPREISQDDGFRSMSSCELLTQDTERHVNGWMSQQVMDSPASGHGVPWNVSETGDPRVEDLELYEDSYCGDVKVGQVETPSFDTRCSCEIWVEEHLEKHSVKE